MNKYFSLYIIIIFLIVISIFVVFIPQSEYIDGTLSYISSDKNVIYELLNAPINGFIGIDDGNSISYLNSGTFSGVATLALLIFAIYSYTYIILKTELLQNFLASHADFINKNIKIFIFAVITFFVAGAYTHGMYETTIGLSIALFAIFSQLGYLKIYVAKIILYSTSIGYMTSTINPFATSLASQLAGVSLSEGFITRIVLFIVLYLFTVYHLLKISDKYKIARGELQKKENKSYNLDFVVFILPFIYLSYSYLPFDLPVQLDMNGLILLFIIFCFYFGYKYFASMTTTLDYFLEAFKESLMIIIILSMSRGIYVILVNTHVVDTIIYAFTEILSPLNIVVIVFLLFMFFMLLSTLISSSSAVALITIPILAQTFINLELNLGLLVTIYQSAIGILHIFSITSVVVLILLTKCKITYLEWIKECYGYVIIITLISFFIIIFSTLFM